MYECFVSVDRWEDQTVDSHIWWIGGGPFVPVSQIGLLELDEDGLKTALIISLFSDRRLVFGGDPPLTENDRRGWWGDNTLEPNDYIGSRLWTLARYKMINELTASEAEEMVNEALAWLVTDGVAEFFTVDVARLDNYSLGIKINIKKPNDNELKKYYFVWKKLLTDTGA